MNIAMMAFLFFCRRVTVVRVLRLIASVYFDSWGLSRTASILYVSDWLFFPLMLTFQDNFASASGRDLLRPVGGALMVMK
jgi:hypothetical protein